MKVLEKEVQVAFRYLFDERGFELAKLGDDYAGNVVVVKNHQLVIRFVTDRADFFADIGLNDGTEKLIGFYELLDELKAKGEIEGKYKYSNKIRPVSRLLKHYFREIAAFFGLRIQ